MSQPTPVELREFLNGRRTFTTPVAFEPVQVRSDGAMQLRGYAAVFEQNSSPIWGMFIERIARGAFRKTLADGPDCVLNFNHGGQPMARTTSDTLRLKEDTTGLHIEADLADTQLSRDIHTLVERGDLTKMSFAFTVKSDKWERDVDELDGMDLRTILEFGGLFDVAVVTTPAYPDTSVETVSRSADEPDAQQAGGGSGEQPTDQGAADTDTPTDRTDVSANNEGDQIRIWLARHHTRSTHDEPCPEGAARSRDQAA